MPIKISSTANTATIENTEGTSIVFESNKISTGGGLFVDVDPSALSPANIISFPGPVSVNVSTSPAPYLDPTIPAPSNYTIPSPAPVVAAGYPQSIIEGYPGSFYINVSGDAAGVEVPYSFTGPAANTNDLYFPQHPAPTQGDFISGSITSPGILYWSHAADQTTETYPEYYEINLPSFLYPAGTIHVELAEGSYTPQPIGSTPPYKVGGQFLSGTYDYRAPGYYGILGSGPLAKGVRFAFPQPELIAGGFSPGSPVTLNSATVYIYKNTETAATTYTNYQLAIGHHPQNNWPRTNSLIFGTGPTIPQGATQTVVYGPTPLVVPTTALGAFTIPFSTPFTYPGTGSIQITAISQNSPYKAHNILVKELKVPTGLAPSPTAIAAEWGPPAPSTYPNNQSYVFVYPGNSNSLSPTSFFPNIQYARPVIHFNTT